MIEIRKYDLPDMNIFHNQDINKGFFCWIPDKTYIVLGNSNKPDQNIKEDAVKEDNVLVYKRPSGGQTVILTPETLVISVKLVLEKFSDPQKYFQFINNHIKDGLKDLGITNVNSRGISDIAIGEKKILGSSIYRKKNILFYHSVLNVSEHANTIEKYLKHPAKEPSYRKKRSHAEFVTSLYAEGYNYNVEEIKFSIQKKFNAALKEEYENNPVLS